MKPMYAVLGLVLCSLLAACQTTKVTTMWEAPKPWPVAKFTKVIALVVNTTPGERRAGEDQLASQIHTAQGVPGYTLISDEDLKDRAKVESIVKSNGFDGAVVMRLVSSDKSSVYHPPTYSPSSSLYGFQPYGGYGGYGGGYYDPGVYSAGYTVTTVTIHVETSIYYVPQDKLLWAGSSSTDDPANVRDLVRQVSEAVVDTLKKQGHLQ